MKRILVTGAGGPATTSFVRSLRDVETQKVIDSPIHHHDGKREYRIIGVDAGKYNVFRSEADRTYLCPKATDEAYIPFINMIIEREKIDFIHSQPEIELYELSKHRDELSCKHFMPKHETVERCRNKWLSYCDWSDAGIKVPEGFLISHPDILEYAFKRLKQDIWLRDIVGAAGKGSMSHPTFREAQAHIDKRRGWGTTMVAQHLTDKTITWQSIWNEGQLVVAQGVDGCIGSLPIELNLA